MLELLQHFDYLIIEIMICFLSLSFIKCYQRYLYLNYKYDSYLREIQPYKRQIALTKLMFFKEVVVFILLSKYLDSDNSYVKLNQTLDVFFFIICINLLFILFYFDLKFRLLPDTILAILLIVFVTYRVLDYLLQHGFNSQDLFVNGLGIIDSSSAIFIFLLLYMLSRFCLKENSIGAGDFKMLFVLGFYFMLGEWLFMIICACFLSLIYSFITKMKTVPLGSFMALACIILFFIMD